MNEVPSHLCRVGFPNGGNIPESLSASYLTTRWSRMSL